MLWLNDDPVYRRFTGGKPRRVCREDRGEAGEDHRWLRRYNYKSISMCAALNQSLQSWILSLCLLFSLLLCTSLCFFPFLLSLSLCSPTCRRTVQSEAEIQGDQRGVGSCPQWSEHLVMLHSALRIFSLAMAHLKAFVSFSSVLSILNAK